MLFFMNASRTASVICSYPSSLSLIPQFPVLHLVTFRWTPRSKPFNPTFYAISMGSVHDGNGRNVRTTQQELRRGAQPLIEAARQTEKPIGGKRRDQFGNTERNRLIILRARISTAHHSRRRESNEKSHRPNGLIKNYPFGTLASLKAVQASYPASAIQHILFNTTNLLENQSHQKHAISSPTPHAAQKALLISNALPPYAFPPAKKDVPSITNSLHSITTTSIVPAPPTTFSPSVNIRPALNPNPSSADNPSTTPNPPHKRPLPHRQKEVKFSPLNRKPEAPIASRRL